MYGACVEERATLRYSDEVSNRRHAEVDEDQWYKEPSESHQWSVIHVVSRRRENVVDRFRELAAKWRHDTVFTSSISERLRHPSYKQILAMGQAALPLILEDLERTHFYWFPVLAAITQESPVPPHDIGNVRQMTEAWLDWGRKRGLV